MFTSILKLNIKTKYLKGFYNSNIKIWICPDIIQINVDIKNIVQII